MREFEYTSHAEWKLTLPEIKKLRITKNKIEKVIVTSQIIDNSEETVLISMGDLNNKLTLCVVHRLVKGKIRIITFYPAEKGRYERKILSGR